MPDRYVALDSSFDVPTRDQARAAYAAGVRAWGGYFGSRDGLGLAVRWSRTQFEVLQQAGLTAIGFCSGWDDPDWIRTTAAAWGILPCVDVERGIREDGPWVMPWVQRAQSGLYGAMAAHYETGEPPGRGAAFNILAWYPGYDPASTWFDAIELRPPGPCGWQWQGDHTEFGLSVDRSWLDPSLGGNTPTGGFLMAVSDAAQQRAVDQIDNLFTTFTKSAHPDSDSWLDVWSEMAADIAVIKAASGIGLTDAQVAALAAALAPHLQQVDVAKLEADLEAKLPATTAAAVKAALRAALDAA